MGLLYLMIGLVFVSLFDLRMGSFSSLSISVLELKLLARSRSEFSKLSSNVFGLVLLPVNTLPFSSLSKSFWSACLVSVMARSTSVSVIFAGTMVSGPGAVVACGEFGLVRSRTSFGLSLPSVPVLSVVLVSDSGVFGLSVSINGVSDSLSNSITVVRLCLDGDLINRPSGPRGPNPLLFCSWLNLEMGLLIVFLCRILPFGVVTVCFVPDTANCGLSDYALSNFLPCCFFSKKKKG